MTAAEVVQHVNLVLMDVYKDIDAYARYETRHKAELARYSSDTGYWHVTVRKTTQKQRLYSGLWRLDPAEQTQTNIEYYLFEETTAQLTPTGN